jgi:hypothetical protein
MYLKEIEHLLKNDTRFDISQTFGLAKKQDFELGFVADTFDKLMFQDTVIPSLATFENTILMQFKVQLSAQNVTGEEIHGRIARMWASLIREEHAYYLLLETGKKYGLDKNDIIRNPDLDVKKGIDVYLRNKFNLSESGKLDILQATKESVEFRDIKDTRRIKGQDVPGKKEKIKLGTGKYATPDATKQINNWYLLHNDYAYILIKKYLPFIQITRSMILKNFLGFQK